MRVNKINNNNMSISLRAKEFCLLVMFAFMSLTAYSQITVHGTVKNDKGDGMAGAFIRVDSTNIITLTDLRGSFHLSIPEIYKNRQVVVSYVGYLNESFKASDGNFDIVLRAKETQTIADVLVSTQKRLQSTVEVPIALSVIDSAKIRQTDLYSIDEMSRFVPGFTALVLNEENTVYGIRGVSSSMHESYAQSRVSVYVDGISISRLQSSYLELFDMERVEVVKGPQ
ncbi:MAG: TonB-dependent receptor plug domain-containing protein, partial [Bacteroidales bacterium]|nr:TonB-dependent receptor plug domain-containing protein [Bacteroidales bacterium]